MHTFYYVVMHFIARRIDGSLDDGSRARLVNDEHRKPNCVMKLIVSNGTPHLCLYAMRDISANEEICYNYGPGNHYPWRQKVVKTFFSFTFPHYIYTCLTG